VRAIGRIGAAACLSAVVVAGGCGKKGPPLAPLRPVPAPVLELVARRMGGDVHIQFRIPDTNTDKTTPAQIARVEVHAITGAATDSTGRPLDERTFVRRGEFVSAVDVKPPPAEENGETADEPAATPPPDPRPGQNDVALVVETLTPEDFQPIGPEETEDESGPAAPPPVIRVTPPLVGVPDEGQVARTYLVFGVTGREQFGAPATVAVPLVPVPPAPAAPAITYTESTLQVAWDRPAGLRHPVQGGPPSVTVPPGQDPPLTPFTFDWIARAPVLPSRPIGASSLSVGFNVYDVRPGQADPSSALRPLTPLNAQPVDATVFQFGGVTFGAERCFQVRTVIVTRALNMESEPSPVACATPVDRFPPAVPRSLAAVATDGAINLIWEPNAARDVAGYHVLRAKATGETLQPITTAPITETTFSDTSVQRGVRYVYAVVAIDAAEPPNVSPPSNRVEETAR
jgi:hypothetical protein